jgi:hypothetical protein
MSHEAVSPNVPTLTLHPRDVAAIAQILRGYLAYAKAKTRTSQPAEYLLALQRLYERFASVSPQVQTVVLPLTQEELHTLSLGVEGYLCLLEQFRPQTQELALMRQELNRFHQDLKGILGYL